MNILNPFSDAFAKSDDPYRDMDPITRHFLNQLAAADNPPLEQLAPEEARKVLSDAQKSINVDTSGIDVEHRVIEIEGHMVSLTVTRPTGAKGTLPGVMFFHGGGWVLGDFPTHERLVRDLCLASGCAMIFVNYGRSPEAEYPSAVVECFLATKWVSESGKEIKVDGKNIAVAGNSAGANMATVVCLMAKENGNVPAIKHQTLFWPVTDAEFDTESYRRYEEGYFLTRNMMRWFWDQYSSHVDAKKEMYASPLRTPLGKLEGMPPTLLQTAEYDVLRDEGEHYAHLLMQAGVEVTATRYLGTIHDFGLLNALAITPASKNAIAQAAQEIRKHLGVQA
jgi:acetyl esterase